MTIMGDCPYEDCDEHQWRSEPDVPLPVIGWDNCEGCGRKVWVWYSRVDPKVWTDEGFRQEWNVDEATKQVTRKADA